MEQGQSLGSVHWNEHLHQELFVLRLQRQGKAVDDAAEGGHRGGQQSQGCLTGARTGTAIGPSGEGGEASFRPNPISTLYPFPLPLPPPPCFEGVRGRGKGYKWDCALGYENQNETAEGKLCIQ